MGREAEDDTSGGYRPRKKVEPDDGRECHDWPDMEDPERATQTFSRRGFLAGFEGGEADGEPSRLASMVPPAVSAWIAAKRGPALDEMEALEKQIATAPQDSQTAVDRAGDHDRETTKHVDEAEAARERREVVRDRLARLTPGQRGGRLDGKEFALAASSTGVLDGSVFALMIGSLGGPFAVRAAIALGLTAAFTVIVATAGRMLGELARRSMSRPQRTGGFALALLLATLIGLSAGAIVSAGGFRADAIVNIGRGLPADPSFLIWVQGALTLAAVCAISAYHVAREGAQLRKDEKELTALIEQLDQKARESQDAASTARNDAREIMAAAEAAKASLKIIPQRLEAEIEELREKGNFLVELVFERFAEGKRARARAEAERRRPIHTVDDELREAVRQFASAARRN